jgi:hypothetical protein
MVSLLVGRGANVHARNRRGETPLHEAARNWRVDAVRVLLEAGADPNAGGFQLETPLELANRLPTDESPPAPDVSEKDRVEVVRLLQAHGADTRFQRYPSAGAAAERRAADRAVRFRQTPLGPALPAR